MKRLQTLSIFAILICSFCLPQVGFRIYGLYEYFDDHCIYDIEFLPFSEILLFVFYLIHLLMLVIGFKYYFVTTKVSWVRWQWYSNWFILIVILASFLYEFLFGSSCNRFGFPSCLKELELRVAFFIWLFSHSFLLILTNRRRRIIDQYFHVDLLDR